MRMNNLTRSAVGTNIFVLLIMLLITPGCNKELTITESDKKPLLFSALKFEGNITRLTGNEWDSGDEIGVFAHKNGESLSQTSIIDNYANYVYTTTGSGSFYAGGEDLYYPEDKTPMDIVAYYPYTANVTNFVASIDIKDQKEFLYSNNLKALTEPKGSEASKYTFNFSRILSSLSLNISSTTLGASLEELTVKIGGGATKASFNLSNAELSVDDSSVEQFVVSTTGTKSERKLQAFMLPTDNEEEIELTFSIGNTKLYTWKVPHRLESGKKYSYNIKLNHTDTEIVTEDGYMEVPLYAGGGEAPSSIQVLHMVGNKNWLNSAFTYGDEEIRNYTALYDKENRVPYWVAFPLHPIYMDSGNRTDDWAYDPFIPESDQPNLLSGWKTANLDRGHLMASADRSATRNLNRTTFYFSNITPQNSWFNQNSWNNLEERVRTWSKNTARYDTLYVVTGVVLPKPPKQIVYAYDIDDNKSVIPEYFYKALLRKDKQTNKYSSIGFYMENDGSKSPYTQRIMSVAELEDKTGFTFFPNLHPSVAAEVKQNASLSPHWQ